MMDYLDRACAGKFDGRMRWLIKWWPKRDAATATAWIRPLLDAAAHDGARRDMGMNDSDILADEWADADPKAASGDFAKAFAIRIPVAGEIGNPDLIAHARLAVGSAHLLEQRGRRRVVADVIERLDFRVSLHVGLTREDENLERFRCREDLQG